MMKTFNIREFFVNKVTFLAFSFLLSAFYFSTCPAAFGQEEYPIYAASPPIKGLTQESKDKLEAEKDIKRRLNLAVSMMEVHLKNAETLNGEEEFLEMFRELGFFHAIMDNTLDFLNRNNYGRGKVLNQFKRFEMNLRSFIGRLEVLRRELPPRWEFYVRMLVKAVRDARSRSVEPLFGETVLPNNSEK